MARLYGNAMFPGRSSATDGHDGLAIEIRHLHPARLIAAEDLCGLAAHALQYTGMITASVADDDDIARLGLVHGNGVTERGPGFRKSIGFGRLPARLAGDGMQEKAAPRCTAGICPENILQALVVFGFMQSGVFFSLVQHASRS